MPRNESDITQNKDQINQMFRPKLGRNYCKIGLALGTENASKQNSALNFGQNQNTKSQTQTYPEF